MRLRAFTILGLAALSVAAGCKSPDGHVPPCPPPDQTRGPKMFVTREVYENPRPSEPGTIDYVADDLTHGGAWPGRKLGIGEQIIRRPGTAYRVRASFTTSTRRERRVSCRYDALTAPTPPFQTSALASATFEQGSLIVRVGAGWAYVSGDMPVTDTGVVQTSTLGSQASGEWIGDVLPGGKQHVVYNVGKGPTNSLAITVRGVTESRRLMPGEKFEFNIDTGAKTWSRYDPHEPFLEEVVKIAAAAGLTISP